MRVVATAGHVDHGKSTLVKALTGMEPDRLDEERRRGLTVDLGFVWTAVGDDLFAFVDVPGHQRFVPTMLAGAGPVASVLFVVAADEGWQEQSSEHLAALDAFGVRHGVLAVTKADRADPAPVLAEARERVALTSLGPLPAVAVSGRTGEGLGALRAALAASVRALPVPDPDADVRLWVDRAFTVRGAGTVVTGTLPAGTLRVGDELALGPGGTRCHVRGLQSLGTARDEVVGAARVAVNLRGVDHHTVRRGDVLLAPGAWRHTTEIDVRLHGGKAAELHRELVLHLGAAAVGCRVRPLGADLARLTLVTALPLRARDRGLLRDPGEHRVPAGAEVLDPSPPELGRRGASRARALELRDSDPALLYVGRYGVVPLVDLRTLGWEAPIPPVGRWVVADGLLSRLADRARAAHREWRGRHPLAAGQPAEALRRELDVPTDLLPRVLSLAGLVARDGLVTEPGDGPRLPPEVDSAVREVERGWSRAPFSAPEAGDLARLGLGPRQLAAAERAGRLLRLTDGIVLGPDALDHAVRVLATVGDAFTVSRARKALDTTRRVAVPLLERLDAEGRTRRHEDGTRTLTPQT